MNKLFWILPLLLLTQCDKDPQLSGNVDGTYLNFSDSTALAAYSVPCTDLNTKNTDYVPLGILTDSRFGKSEASFYSQLRLTTNAYSLGANAVFDSAVLHLALNGSYGSLTSSMNIEVYRLEEDLVSTDSYTQNADLSVGATLIASLPSYVFDEDAAYISVPLTAATGNELFGLLGTSNMDNSDNFLEYFKGIYVKINSSSGGDGHVLLDLTDDATALKLYFRSDLEKDSVYNFIIDDQAIRVNKFTHDYSSSLVEAAFNDNANDDEVIYLGGLNTSRAFIDVPDLSFLQGNIINQAKLTFYQADYGSAANDDYDEPVYLFLSGYKEGDSTQYTLTDYLSGYPTAYGGLKELVDVNGSSTNAYTYYLPKFIQRVVNQTTEVNTLCIEIIDANTGSRIALGGGTHPQFGIKFEIVYSN